MRLNAPLIAGKARLPALAASVRSQTNSIGRPGRDVALLDFVQYAIRAKIEFAAVRPDTVDGLRGLFATANIAPKDTLVAVPRASGLVVVPGESSPYPRHLSDAAWAGLPWWVTLDSYMVLLAR